MKEFNIAMEYCTSITNIKEWNMYTENGRIPTADELLKVLAGKGRCSVTSSKDHSEFVKLRNQLAAEGFIRIETGWINGDRVTRPFILNGVKFELGTSFPSAAAMAYRLDKLKRHK